MEKAPDAFRTISEVATWLDTPAHVLRFWESRFPQIKPVKRAGGRRYYRREDMALLGGIKFLLHEQGLTIRGVQKILSEQGIRHVASLSVATPGEEQEAAIDGTAAAPQAEPQAATQRVAQPQPSAPADTAPAQPGPDMDAPGSQAALPSPGAVAQDADAPPQADRAGDSPSPGATRQEAGAEPGQTPGTPGPIEPAAPSPAPAAGSAAESPAESPAAEEPPASGQKPPQQSELAFGDGSAAVPATHSDPHENDAGEPAEGAARLLSARLRAGARIADGDRDTVLALAKRLAALRARMADRRGAASGPR